MKTSVHIGGLLGIALLAVGCQGPSIEGKVVDPFQKPLRDVAISIEKSAYQATTDSSGGYSLKYAPGVFTIRYAKPSFTTVRLELTLTEKTLFQAQAAVLYPIPSEAGLYHIGTSDLTALVSSQTARINSVGSMSSEHRYYATGDFSIRLDAGSAQFIDTYPKPLALVKYGREEGGAFLIYHVINRLGVDDVQYNGMTETKDELLGDERLKLRSVNLTPGRYAFTELGPGPTMISDQAPGKTCFPFVVDAAASK